MTELPIVVNMTVDASRTEYDLTAESNLEEIELSNDVVIETGADVSGVTATAADVLSGKYFVDSSGVLTLGTGTGGAMDSDTKDALLACFENVAWIGNDGENYYNDLLNALYPLQSISATYTQSGTVYTTTPLDDLKSDLIVTATFDDGTVKTVNNYTLSGTLAVGTSTVTVTYFTETTTFNVTVTPLSPIPSGYTQYDYLALDYENGTNINGNSRAILIPSITLSADYTYELEAYAPNSSSTGSSTAYGFLGARSGASGTKLFGLFYTPNSTKIGYWLNGTDTATTINAFEKNTVNKIRILPVGASTNYPSHVVIEVNNVEYDSQSTASGINYATYLAFFKYATSSSGVNSSTMNYNGIRLGRFTVKNGNTTVYDFYPVSNGTYYGYYEVSTETFYTLTGFPEKCIGGNWS